MRKIWLVEESTKIMSSGQFVRHESFNKTIMRDGLILTLRKDGTVKVQRDPKTGDIIKGQK